MDESWTVTVGLEAELDKMDRDGRIEPLCEALDETDMDFVVTRSEEGHVLLVTSVDSDCAHSAVSEVLEALSQVLTDLMGGNRVLELSSVRSDIADGRE